MFQPNDQRIWDTLSTSESADSKCVRDILSKALELHGLEPAEVAILSQCSDPELIHELFECARSIKETIYGKRLVLFAPLYVSNLCNNECLYCAFRKSNKIVARRILTPEEIIQETLFLVNQGHKRVLLVAGEAYFKEGLEYLIKAIETVYAVKTEHGNIRRINVNIAPLTSEEFRELNSCHIGTYQLFQETYHRETYQQMHVSGPKSNYDWRISAIDRAVQSGIEDVGIGVLFGLMDWRYELLALLEHVHYLENEFGVGPHTVSVPRLEPASGSLLSEHPPKPVSDADFRKIVALLRLAVPYTGIIMSTRETASIRKETFALGVSQISAGSRTRPGGYSMEQEKADQFSLGDHRSLDEVIRDIAGLGYMPSFCTACYRLGRTGEHFMELAKPGNIKYQCQPNALFTFEEYLLDFATPKTKELGKKLIQNVLQEYDEKTRKKVTEELLKIQEGKRDLFW